MSAELRRVDRLISDLERQLEEVKKLAGRWQEAALQLAPVTAGAIAFNPMQPEAWIAAIKAREPSPEFLVVARAGTLRTVNRPGE